MSKIKKKNVIKITGFLISGIFLYFTLKEIDFKDVWATLKNFNLYFTFWGIFLFLLANVIRGIRWKLMLKPVKKVSLMSSIAALFVDILGNNILPARLGDLWRSIAMKHTENVPVTTALSSLIVERILDGLVILLGAFFGRWLFTEVPQSMKEAIMYLTGGIFLAVLIFFLIYIVHEHRYKNCNSKIAKQVRKIISALRFLGDAKNTLYILGLSILSWTVEFYSYYYFLRAIGYRGPMSLALFVMVAVNIGVSIPSGPGYFGVFEYATLLAFYAYGLPKELGLTYAFITHALRYISGSLVGFILGSKWYLFPSKEEEEVLEEFHLPENGEETLN